jgi:hypothetical protein
MTSVTLMRGIGLAALVMGLAACGAPNEPEAPAEVAPPTQPETPETPAAGEADHDMHDEDHDEHDGEEDDHHAHHEEDEDLAGGEAHEHGAAEAALVLQGETLTLSLDTPLDSFGVREAAPETAAQEAEHDTLANTLAAPDTVFSVNPEAGCTLTSSDVAFRHHGDHGAALLTYTYECASPEELDRIGFEVFTAYPGFHTVDAVILNGAQQSTGLITEEVTELAWPESH